MIVFTPLWQTMEEKGISQYKLIKDHEFSPATITRLRHDKNVNLETVDRLCIALKCDVNDVIEFKVK